MQQILINTGMTDSNGKSANLSITLSDDTIEQIEALDKMKQLRLWCHLQGIHYYHLD